MNTLLTEAPGFGEVVPPAIDRLFNPNQPVRQRNGRPGRIICSNRKGSIKPIVALLEDEMGCEHHYEFYATGQWLLRGQTGIDLINKEGTSKSVVQSWLSERLTLRMQATVLSALRGCDGSSKNSPSKKLTRALRAEILNPADPDFMSDPNNTFMRGQLNQEDVDLFLVDIDCYPGHWLFHFAHAVMLIGYFHPVEDKAAKWLSLYHALCNRMHMNCETKDQVGYRLRDGRRTAEEENGARARI